MGRTDWGDTMQQCSICGTSNFAPEGNKYGTPLCCWDCGIVFCDACAGRSQDPPGVPMLQCPACHTSTVEPANPTPERSAAIRDAILEHLPDADIRTDQNSTVRVYWRDTCSHIAPLEIGGYRVTAGDELAQSRNLVYEMAHSSLSPSQSNAVEELVGACQSIVSKRK